MEMVREPRLSRGGGRKAYFAPAQPAASAHSVRAGRAPMLPLPTARASPQTEPAARIWQSGVASLRVEEKSFRDESPTSIRGAQPPSGSATVSSIGQFCRAHNPQGGREASGRSWRAEWAGGDARRSIVRLAPLGRRGVCPYANHVGPDAGVPIKPALGLMGWRCPRLGAGRQPCPGFLGGQTDFAERLRALTYCTGNDAPQVETPSSGVVAS